MTWSGIGRALSLLLNVSSNEADAQRDGVPPETYRDDVFLVSYPRSGNTWVRQMLTAFRNPGKEITPELLAQTVYDLHGGRQPILSMPSPRLFKSHEGYSADYHRVVYLYRDGRDVACSYFNFLVTRAGYGAGFDEFLEEYLTGEVPHGSWQGHVSSWMFSDRPTEILSLRYEALCEQTHIEMEKLLRFVGLPLDAKNLEQAIARSTFRKRREYVKKYHPDLFDAGYRAGIRGGPGAWRDYFTPKHLRLYSQYAGEVHDRLGYPWPLEAKGPSISSIS